MRLRHTVHRKGGYAGDGKARKFDLNAGRTKEELWVCAVCGKMERIEMVDTTAIVTIEEKK